MPKPTVIDESTTALPAEMLVAVSPEVLIQLAERESEPLAILGIVDHPTTKGAFTLILRRPTRQELQAAIMQRFKIEGANANG